MTTTRGRPRQTQQERSDATTTAILATARDLFGRDGYAATSLDEVASAAGLSKGALYHHFADKPDLFRAVFEREQRALAEHVVAAASRKRDPWDAFFAGCRAFLEASLDPAVQRITLRDAPGVLGWEQMRELESPHSFAVLRAGVHAAVAAGRLESRNPTVLAHLVLGAMCESVAVVAASEHPQRAIRAVLAELRGLMMTPAR